MTPDLEDWVELRTAWLNFATDVRTRTPVDRVDQYDARMRDVCDALDVDLHNDRERNALISGVICVLCSLPPGRTQLQTAANVLGTLVAPWWQT